MERFILKDKYCQEQGIDLSTVVRLYDSLPGQLTERRDKFDRFEETAKQFCDGGHKEEKSHKRNRNRFVDEGTRIARSLA